MASLHNSTVRVVQSAFRLAQRARTAAAAAPEIWRKTSGFLTRLARRVCGTGPAKDTGTGRWSQEEFDDESLVVDRNVRVARATRLRRIHGPRELGAHGH